jgi:hypothetical protein
VYSDIVLSGKVRGAQEDKICGQKPGGFSRNEAYEDRKNETGDPVKNSRRNGEAGSQVCKTLYSETVALRFEN